MGVATGIDILDKQLNKTVLQLNGHLYSGKTNFAINYILYHNAFNLRKRVLYIHPHFSKQSVIEALAVRAIKDGYGVDLSEEDKEGLAILGFSLVENRCQFEVSNSVSNSSHYDIIILDFEEEDGSDLLNHCDNLVVVRNQLELFINPEYDILSIETLGNNTVVTNLNSGSKAYVTSGKSKKEGKVVC